MFSRWTHVRLKAAERALSEGRVDEAFERLVVPDVAKLKRAAGLLDELGRALVARARLHAQSGRYRDGLAELERVDRIGRGGDEECNALRKRMEQELRHRVDRHAEQHEAYNKAAENLRAGRLESGRLAVERLEDPARRERLKEELDAREQRSDQLLDRAAAALKRGEVLTACRYWEDACTRHGRSEQTDEFADGLANALRSHLDECMGAGRLDQVVLALAAAPTLRVISPALSEFERTCDLAKRAASKLMDGDFVGVREALLRLQAGRSSTKWVGAALKSLDTLLEARSTLLSSPLGLLGDSLHQRETVGSWTETVAARRGAKPPVTLTQGERPARVGSRPLLMLVDGTGSALIVGRDVTRIGRADPSHAVEIPMSADIQSHHADIIRDGEDYFLIAHGPVTVNRQRVSRRLLRNGDRVTLGPKAKFVFQKPSPMSDTAVLNLSSRCRLPQDVSMVVLFRGTCLLGPQAGCHVRTREGDSRLVLFDRAGDLYVRRADRAGRPTGPAEQLPERQTREIGDIRLTVKEYDVTRSGELT